jgi:hypothetical protein
MVLVLMHKERLSIAMLTNNLAIYLPFLQKKRAAKKLNDQN